VESENTIALEWLDFTLAHIVYKPSWPIYEIIRAVLQASLSSCSILADQKYVNTGTVLALSKSLPLLTWGSDFKPANILLSGIGTEHLIAKVGDLGCGE
jgi:hypothetical protein